MRQQGKPSAQPSGSKNTLSEIQRLQKDRDDRRRNMEQYKLERAAEIKFNRENGTPGDVDFQRMIKHYRSEQAPIEQPHLNKGEMKITICVRKRPISQKEVDRFDYDSATCANPLVVVHYCKLKVDGIHKFLENNSFEVDHTFHEENTTEELYNSSVEPLVPFVLKGGRATVFAYGQTGSGKTYTMVGIQTLIANDLFRLLEYNNMHDTVSVMVSMFEIYGGRCQDLLNNRNRLVVREDGSGEVIVSDLMDVQVSSMEELQAIIDTGNQNRTTHATESNDESSRSHSICQIAIKNKSSDKVLGRLSLIDLAGSERGADTKSHNRQRRMEGAEINKSLLALKECIRALDKGGNNASHVPYRGSKLTLVLKDSFTNKLSRTVMIANISPAASSADHTINTLRYADRIKERTVGSQQAAAAAKQLQNPSSNNSKAVPKPIAINATPVPSAKGNDNKDVIGNKERNINTEQSISESKFGGERERRYSEDVSDKNEGENYDDIDFNKGGYDNEADEDIDELQKTVQDLFDEEEELLNMHMNIIQENAELLTEEGRLLSQIQSDDDAENDIDSYANNLDRILDRKQELIVLLREKLTAFRQNLVKEEMVSQRVRDKR